MFKHLRFMLMMVLVTIVCSKASAAEVEDNFYNHAANPFNFYNMGYVPLYEDGCWKFGKNFRLIQVGTDDCYQKDGDNFVLDGEGNKVLKPELEDCPIINQNGKQYYYQTLTNGSWFQFFASNDVSTQVGTKYKLTAYVKASKSCEIDVNFGTWGNTNGGKISVSTEWAEQSVEIEAPVASCFIVFQFWGDPETVIELKSLTVTHEDESLDPDFLCMSVSGLNVKENAGDRQPWDQQITYTFDPMLPADNYEFSMDIFGDVEAK